MAEEFCQCPTCGAPYLDERPRVDLGRNIFICAAGATRVTPKHAEILHVMLEKYPAATGTALIFDRIHGVNDGPESGTESLRAHMSNIRRSLHDLGWTVKSDYNHTYRLERIEA